MDNERYGFDIDDVLCNFVPLLIEEYNKAHNTKFDIKDIDTFWMFVYWEERLAWNDLKKVIIEKDLYSIVEGIDSMIAYVNSLYAKGHDIYLITARENEHKEETVKWLADRGVNHTALYFTNEKNDLCNKLNITSFIDDKLETILNISKYCPNTKPILQMRPWNGKREMLQLVKEWKFTEKEIYKLLRRVGITI